MSGILEFVFSTVFLLAGCAVSQPAAVPNEEVIPEERITELLNVYASVLNETFGAKIDFSHPSFTDDLASYYEVANFKTVAEIKQYVSDSLEESVYDPQQIDNDFLEQDGALYAVRGGRGYGYYGIDPTDWHLEAENSISVQFYILGDPIKDKRVSIKTGRINGIWKIVNAELPDQYQ